MKKYIFAIIMLIIFVVIMPSQDVYASIIKQETSSININTYYISTKEENFLTLNLIKARMETKVRIIYVGDMANSYKDYLNDGMFNNLYPLYKMLNISIGNGSLSGYSITQTQNLNDTTIIKLNLSYRNEKEQIEYINNTINSAIKENISNLKTDYDKAYWAYCWVLDNVQYDFTYSNFSAYDGLQSTGTVCDGYASLYAEIANKLGLNCVRIVGGVNGGYSNHSWNIIKLNGLWYCVDTTWGDYHGAGNYFLKSKDLLMSMEYGSHISKLYDTYITAGEQFSTTDYNPTIVSEAHTIMPSVYNVEMDVLKYNVLAVGEKYTFMISNPDDIELKFRNSSSKVAKVNKNGVITGKRKGTTVITIYNDELGFEQSCTITVQ